MLNLAYNAGKISHMESEHNYIGSDNTVVKVTKHDVDFNAILLEQGKIQQVKMTRKESRIVTPFGDLNPEIQIEWNEGKSDKIVQLKVDENSSVLSIIYLGFDIANNNQYLLPTVSATYIDGKIVKITYSVSAELLASLSKFNTVEDALRVVMEKVRMLDKIGSAQLALRFKKAYKTDSSQQEENMIFKDITDRIMLRLLFHTPHIMETAYAESIALIKFLNMRNMIELYLRKAYPKIHNGDYTIDPQSRNLGIHAYYVLLNESDEAIDNFLCAILLHDFIIMQKAQVDNQQVLTPYHCITFTPVRRPFKIEVETSIDTLLVSQRPGLHGLNTPYMVGRYNRVSHGKKRELELNTVEVTAQIKRRQCEIDITYRDFGRVRFILPTSPDLPNLLKLKSYTFTELFKMLSGMKPLLWAGSL